MPPDNSRAILIRLHGIEQMTWRQIAALDEFHGIPAGTLCSFAKGGYEPKLSKEHRRKLGLSEIIEQEVVRDEKGRFTKVRHE